ncbi:MAG: N-acetylmuramoyl-L-alanine amidase [Flavobacteriaceae bacterium]
MRLKVFVFIPVSILALLLISFGKNTNTLENADEFIIVLDAGHGGHDPGNLGNGYLEKNIALNIVLRVGAILEKNPGVKVIYTRKDDTFVDLFVRGEIANKANADLFVSVHCDSHTSDAHGAGTFVLGLHANKQNFEIAKKENSVIYLEDNYETRYADYDINSPESIIGLTIMQEEFLDQSISLAKDMQDNFSGQLKRNNRKVKQAGFIVLHQTFMPSVLVETGFLTNKDEGAYLNSKKGQSEMGKAIADAIMKYKNGVRPAILQTKTTNASLPPVSSREDVKIKEVAQEQANNAIKAVEQAEPVKLDAKENETIKLPIKVEETPKVVVVKEKLEKSIPPPVLKEKTISTEQPKEVATVKEELATAVNIVFKVQILASTKDLELYTGNFKGLGRMSKESYKNMFRYLYGNTNSYKTAQMLKSNADIKGYPSSFIVAYKDGERIRVKEALKYVSE